ncbi:hypothetical protein B9G53_05385 [Pseudanabaena sp. SR411]|nr:hypothetical protein B9G53_05385 [Pseudanabaena sp. SR411]
MATVPKRLTHGTKVLVLADTEFCTVKFLNAVRARAWRVVVGIHCNRKLQVLQQFPIKRTTRKILKALLCNAFKIFLGLGLSAKRCKSIAK